MIRPLSRFCSLLLLCIAATYSVHAEDSDTVWTVKVPRASFSDVDYSPDGRYIVACSGYYVPVGLLDARDGSTVRIFQVPGETPKLSLEAIKVAFSADGSTIAASIDKDSEHFLQFWNVETGEPT